MSDVDASQYTFDTSISDGDDYNFDSNWRFLFGNDNNPAIQNPFQIAAQNTVFGEAGDEISAETLLKVKSYYTPAELNSIVDSYVTQTGDKETGAILKNLFGSDTALSDTAIANAGKIPLGEGDITAAGNTTSQLNKIGSDAANAGKGILGTGISASDAAKYAAMLAMARLAYDDAKAAREEARGWSAPGGVAKQTVRGPSGGASYRKVSKAAGGGIGSLDMTTKQPFYLGGLTDGMADEIPAHIDNKRPAALSDGEFVIPADVVSHLGNGNSNAGAKRLYEMMDNIREARTGNKDQGVQINPNKFMLG
jgi:hypothetical protein